MSETKHTSGPWRSGDGFRTVFGPPNGNPSPETIAHLPQRNEANARLIACSPELLASLKRVVPWLGKMIADKAHLHAVAPLDAENAIAEAEALIAKATNGGAT